MFQQLAADVCSAWLPFMNFSGSSGSGILATLASEENRRRASCTSCCSSSWLPNRRVIRSVVGEEPTTFVRRLMGSSAERLARCDVELLVRVGAPDLASVLLREVQERQHVDCGIHHRHSFQELLAQAPGSRMQSMS